MRSSAQGRPRDSKKPSGWNKIRIVTEPAQASDPFDGDADADAVIQFRSILTLAGDCAIVEGAFGDAAGRVRSVRLGDLEPIELTTLAAGSARVSASSDTPPPRSFRFLGLVPAATGSLGVSIEVESRSGEKRRWIAPFREELQPIFGFVHTAGMGELLDWCQGAVDFYFRLVGPRASIPAEMERIFDEVLGRLNGAGNAAAGLRFKIQVHVEFAERIGSDGVVLKGWTALGETEQMTSCVAISLRGRRAPIALPLCTSLRPDVVAAKSSQVANLRPDCGFVAFAAGSDIEPDDTHWVLETRLANGVVHYCPFRLGPAKSPRNAIETLIDWAEDSVVDRNDLFARALDEPIDLLWRALTANIADPVEASYGARERPPDISVIVPLYGRVDLLRHQLAHFSNDADFDARKGAVEIIYVLDDPRLTREFRLTAAMASQVYNVPFRTLESPANFGYSTANNLGARFARGKTLILLNSDVMPVKPGWASQLARHLAETENAGVLGCRLLYEDESIQHVGIEFQKSAQNPGLWTNEHMGKGLPACFDLRQGLSPAPSVTGACLTIRRQLYFDVGGLSDQYVIGDFEDSDLCLKVKRWGHEVYYTSDVVLYHLERLSMRMLGEGRTDWRQKLTQFNMWRHTRAWGETLAAQQAASTD